MLERLLSPGLAKWRTLVLVCAVTVLCAPAANSQGPVFNQKLTTPRNYGYVLGDQIQHTLEFELAPGYKLDTDRFPRRGRLTRWVSLVDIELVRGLAAFGPRHHRLRLTYQVVNTPRAVLGVGIPPQSLGVLGPNDSADDGFPIIVPAWGLFIAPITSTEERTEGTLATLQPPLPPPTLDIHARILRIVAISIIALLALLWLAYAHFALPFIARTRGPFAVAHRRIARMNRGNADEQLFASALAEAHRAFNLTAGRVVFAHGLDEFFTEHRRFASLTDEIQAMFEVSNSAFFDAAGTQSCVSMDRQSLQKLVRRCRDVERGL